MSPLVHPNSDNVGTLTPTQPRKLEAVKSKNKIDEEKFRSTTTSWSIWGDKKKLCSIPCPLLTDTDQEQEVQEVQITLVHFERIMTTVALDVNNEHNKHT